MPIYEYQCSACGFQKEMLQKISDEPLKTCPECGKDTHEKNGDGGGVSSQGRWLVRNRLQKG